MLHHHRFFWLMFVFWIFTTCHSFAYQTFQSKIPNGQGVVRNGASWPGVGHLQAAGGGARNVFGQDFASAGFQWTKSLCAMDSDGDSFPNGDELGDPSCSWTEGTVPSRVVGISHPGFADSTPPVLNSSSAPPASLTAIPETTIATTQPQTYLATTSSVPSLNPNPPSTTQSTEVPETFTAQPLETSLPATQPPTYSPSNTFFATVETGSFERNRFIQLTMIVSQADSANLVVEPVSSSQVRVSFAKSTDAARFAAANEVQLRELKILSLSAATISPDNRPPDTSLGAGWVVLIVVAVCIGFGGLGVIIFLRKPWMPRVNHRRPKHYTQAEQMPKQSSMLHAPMMDDHDPYVYRPSSVDVPQRRNPMMFNDF